jgi:hypothetical protein
VKGCVAASMQCPMREAFVGANRCACLAFSWCYDSCITGIFTRDFRINEMGCRVLVTVPQCLEILVRREGRFDGLRQAGANLADCSSASKPLWTKAVPALPAAAWASGIIPAATLRLP